MGVVIISLNNQYAFTINPNSREYIYYSLVKKLEKKYPNICICYHGKTVKSNFVKLLNELLNFLDAKKINYSYLFKDKESKQYKEKSSIHQIMIPIKPNKEFIFSRAENHMLIWILDTTEKFKKAINFFKKLKQKNNLSDSEKLMINKLLAIHDKEINESKKQKCYFKTEIKISPIKKISKKIIENGEFLQDEIINDILKIFDSYKKIGKGFTCGSFKFDSTKYGFIGNIELPIDLIKALNLQNDKLAKSIISKTGTPMLNGIEFDIKNSPLGLEKIEAYNENRNYYIGLKTNYKSDKMKNLLMENYLLLQTFINIIMVEKK